LLNTSKNERVVGVNRPLTSNKLSILRSAARSGMSVTHFLVYLVSEAIPSGELRPCSPTIFCLSGDQRRISRAALRAPLRG
jgi:hypothetical protein